MKKQTRLFLLAAAAALLLSGCGGQGQAGQKSAYDTAAVQQIADAGAFSEELEELDGDTAFALYGLADYELSREDMTACAVLRSAGATCEEGAVLVFDKEEKAEKAVAALRDYVQGQAAANESYRPAEIPKLEGALIDQRGATVLMVVASDLDAAKSAVS